MMYFVSSVLLVGLLLAISYGEGEAQIKNPRMAASIPLEYRANVRVMRPSELRDHEAHKALAAKAGIKPDSHVGRSLGKRESWIKSLALLNVDERTAIQSILNDSDLQIAYRSEEVEGLPRIISLHLSRSNPWEPIRKVGLNRALGATASAQVLKFTQLRALSLSNLQKGELDFESLGKMESLLYLEPPLDTTDNDLEEMENIGGIQWLELLGCVDVTGSFLKELGRDCSLRYINLQLSGFKSINLNELIALPDIREISVSAPGVDFGKRVIVSPAELESGIELGTLSGVFDQAQLQNRIREGETLAVSEEIVRMPYVD